MPRIPTLQAKRDLLAAVAAQGYEILHAEGLGKQPFHGRVVLLVNEHTASAGEMVSAFAEENSLATIVGTKTPGRLLSGSAYKVGHGYILGLPVAAYLTWQGRMLENNGTVPKFCIDLSRDALRQGRDTQLESSNGGGESLVIAESRTAWISLPQLPSGRQTRQNCEDT